MKVFCVGCTPTQKTFMHGGACEVGIGGYYEDR